MIEIERKYRLQGNHHEIIKKYLLKLDAAAASVRQIDTVYLQGIHSFKDFKQGMQVIRIRTIGSKSVLTYKKAINDSGDSIEHEVEINNPESMHAILLADNYHKVTEVRKDRIEVKKGELTYTLDYVDQLGWFLEIEILAKDNTQIDDLEQKIKQVAMSAFSLTDSSIEPLKYDQLIANI